MKHAAMALALLSGSPMHAQTPQWCLAEPNPDNRCDLHGDPASVMGGFSWYSVTDLDISTPVGSLVLQRSMYSSSRAWSNLTNNSSTLPRPFSQGMTSIEWWHSLYSFAYLEQATLKYAPGDNGNAILFELAAACMPPASCQATRYNGTGYQARSTPTGLVFTRPDTRMHYHEAKYLDASTLTYLLSKITAPSGATLAEIAYSAPLGTSNCPSAGTPPSGNVVPYISTVTLAGGHVLQFRYSQTVAGAPCPLSSIDYRAPGTSTFTELVRYTLATSPSPVGRVTQARYRGGDAGTESYDYSNSGFAVVRAASNILRHQYDGGTSSRTALVLSGNGNEPTVTVLSQGTNVSTYLPLTTTGGSCIAHQLDDGTELTTRIAGTAGDSANTQMNLTLYYQTARNDSYFSGASAHRRFRLRDSTSCGGSEACSAGENRYELRPIPIGASCAGSERAIGAIKDKRNNWTLLPKLPLPVLRDDGGVSTTFENVPAGLRRGATEVNGSVVSPLETEDYTYLTRAGGRYAMETKTRPGAFGNVTTTYTYDDTGGGLRLNREVTEGWTLTSTTSGSIQARLRATFYRPKTSDPLQRVEFIEGPCWVDSSSSTVCSTSLNPVSGSPAAGWWPITKFEYYGATTDTNSQRLSKTIRYSAGTSGTQLVTEYSNYTPEGDPGKVRSYAVVSGVNSEMVDTDFLYSGRRPISQKLYRSTTPATNAETQWFYDEDQLTAIRSPELNFEVLCYRTSAFPQCTGTFTKRLRWRAKTNARTGFTLATGWSERIEFDYDGNGYQLEERRFTLGDPNPRFRRRTHPDLHGRRTYSRGGDPTGPKNFESKAHFDGADNRDAFGPPANIPPDYCRSGAADSPLCWWFRYDRADRLNRANAPGTPSPLSRSCFDYDAAGNVTKVSTGDSSLNCDTSLNAPGTQTPDSTSSTALVYEWDDFGNVIGVRNTGADTGLTPTRYRFDAQGNVIEKRTPAMQSGDYQKFGYDGLGRLLRVTREGAWSDTLYTLEYDTAASPPFSATREFLFGRLARRNDSYGSTWYGYDYLGNTLSEYRDRTGCNLSKGIHCRPHTFYRWDRNSNLNRITYPFGRVVNYNYYSGAQRDRIGDIKMTVWLTTGASTRTAINGIAWEPYGGLRGYTARLNGAAFRGVEYYLGTDVETDPGNCSATYSSGTGSDGSGRTRALFVSSGSAFSPSSASHVAGPYVFAQRYGWAEDQVSRQRTCLGSTEYEQTFTYDAMQRLTAESMVNFPHWVGEVPSETKDFDARSNRVGGTRDGHAALDQTFDATSKDRMTELCWFRGYLSPGECLVGYQYLYSQTGAMTQMGGLKPGGGYAWTLGFDYAYANTLSDVYSAVRRDGSVLLESFYDAFGRRRTKIGGLGDEQEFMYDLGHQMLIDQTWSHSVASGTADEYIWLAGRPIIAIRSNLSATGAHSNDYVNVPDSSGSACSRPLDDGTVACGMFHLVSNLQSFVNVAMHDYDGKVASFQLPDADGTVNQGRMNGYGGWFGTYFTRFNVPSTFSKQVRIRTSWTGGGYYYYGGVSYYELDGVAVLAPWGSEIGLAWSNWGPVSSGTNDVTWSTICYNDCASGLGMIEWKTWEAGAAQFHTRLRFPGQYHDAETDFYENWNRYYEPATGRYLSPERLVHNPSWVARKTTGAQPVPAYGYARNNPLAYIDPDGLEFVNSSSSPVKVKSESGGWGVVPPHQRYPKKIDGWEDPFTKKKYKVPGKEWVPFDNRVQCSDSKSKSKKDEKPKVRYDCTGGPCRLTGIDSPPDLDSRSDWQPPDDAKPFSENEKL